VHALLVCDIMLGLLIVVYAQFVIMPIELQKVLSQELKGCVAAVPQSYQNELCLILLMWAPYIFIAVDINILYRNVFMLYRNVYTVHIYCTGPYVH
jgi:hypothetical protein